MTRAFLKGGGCPEGGIEHPQQCIFPWTLCNQCCAVVNSAIHLAATEALDQRENKPAASIFFCLSTSAHGQCRCQNPAPFHFPKSPEFPISSQFFLKRIFWALMPLVAGGGGGCIVECSFLTPPLCGHGAPVFCSSKVPQRVEMTDYPTPWTAPSIALCAGCGCKPRPRDRQGNEKKGVCSALCFRITFATCSGRKSSLKPSGGSVSIGEGVRVSHSITPPCLRVQARTPWSVGVQIANRGSGHSMQRV